MPDIDVVYSDSSSRNARPPAALFRTRLNMNGGDELHLCIIAQTRQSGSTPIPTKSAANRTATNHHRPASTSTCVFASRHSPPLCTFFHSPTLLALLARCRLELHRTHRGNHCGPICSILCVPDAYSILPDLSTLSYCYAGERVTWISAMA